MPKIYVTKPIYFNIEDVKLYFNCIGSKDYYPMLTNRVTL